MSGEESECNTKEACGWGCDCGAAQDALRGVAAALIRGAGGAAGAAGALASFSAVCRSWRLAASAPGLWRQALEDEAPHARHAGARWGPDWWREEYILAHVGWSFIKYLAPEEDQGKAQNDNQNNHQQESRTNQEKSQASGENFDELHETNGQETDENNLELVNPTQDPHPEPSEQLQEPAKPVQVNENHHHLFPEPPFGRGVYINHAALSPSGNLLAVVTDDAAIAVWERVDAKEESWREEWRVIESRWSSAWSVQWSPGRGDKLLVVGAMRGTTRGEAAVRKSGDGGIRSRASVAGAAGGAVTWRGEWDFLALEPRLVSVGVSFTLVWMYSATQRVSDAEAEVVAPLFCLYNEGSTHYSHITVIELPNFGNKRRSQQKSNKEKTSDDDDDIRDVISDEFSESEESGGSEVKCGEGLLRPREYYRMLSDMEQENEHSSEEEPEEDNEAKEEGKCFIMVCAGGTKGGNRGICSSLRAWRVQKERKQKEKIGLKERREARERARREEPVELPELDEAAVREMCREPLGEVRLSGAVLGLIGTAGAVWAVTAGGANCVRVSTGAVKDDVRTSVGALTLLATLAPLPHTAPPYAFNTPYYIYPVVSDRLLVSPCVCGCGGVVSWCVRSLCVCAAPPAPRAPRPPLAALLLPAGGGAPERMLVLLGSYIYFPRDTRADMALRLTPLLAPRVVPVLAPLRAPTLPPLRAPALSPLQRGCSCPPKPETPPCECPPVPPPPCRGRAAERLRAKRVVCCPPPQGKRPPCPPPLRACELTCASLAAAHAQPPIIQEEIPPPPPGGSECDENRDLVAKRLAAAKAERQRQYRLAVAQPEPLREAPRPGLLLAGERDCECATDGRTYLLKHEPGNVTAPLPCGPCRTPPPAACVELVPDDACRPQPRAGIDPCQHQPRVLLHIDRSGCGALPPDEPAPAPVVSAAAAAPSKPLCPPAGPQSATVASKKCKDPSKPSSEGITSRIMKSLNIGRSSGSKVAAPKCGEGGPDPGPGKARYAGDQSWCKTAPPPVPEPARCRPSTLTERLGRRPPAPCLNRRKLHISAVAFGAEAKPAAPKDMASLTEKIKADTQKLEQVLQERKQLKPAAIGRSVTCEKPKKCAPKPPVNGSFDFQVPPTSSPLRVRLLYDEICAPVPPRCPSKDPPAQAPSSRAALKPASATNTSCPNAAPVKTQKSDSWLSIKGISKKIAGCCKDDKTKKKESDKKLTTGPTPCADKKEKKSPASPTPCAAAAKLSGKSDDKKIIKPICPPKGPSPPCQPGTEPRCPPSVARPKRDPCEHRPGCLDQSKNPPPSNKPQKKK